MGLDGQSFRSGENGYSQIGYFQDAASSYYSKSMYDGAGAEQHVELDKPPEPEQDQHMYGENETNRDGQGVSVSIRLSDMYGEQNNREEDLNMQEPLPPNEHEQ